MHSWWMSRQWFSTDPPLTNQWQSTSDKVLILLAWRLQAKCVSTTLSIRWFVGEMSKNTAVPFICLPSGRFNHVVSALIRHKGLSLSNWSLPVQIWYCTPLISDCVSLFSKRNMFSYRTWLRDKFQSLVFHERDTK